MFLIQLLQEREKQHLALHVPSPGLSSLGAQVTTGVRLSTSVISSMELEEGTHWVGMIMTHISEEIYKLVDVFSG